MMDTSQTYPSLFAQMVDKLRSKSEEELKWLYLKLFSSDLKKEWEEITKEAGFSNITEEDIINIIRQKRQLK
jgi:ubiquinone/menaquinone biosynthesis C-methylase UbiE